MNEKTLEKRDNAHGIRLGPWEHWANILIARVSYLRIPDNSPELSFPIIRMVIQGWPKLDPMQHNKNSVYEIYLEDSEYNIRTTYGSKIGSIELAKFIADVKLLELGYKIEEPFLLGDKND